jgi:hypothetical protein
LRAAVLAVLLLLPVSLAAQGLGDAAARERQKREAKPPAPPARVFTNRDLPAETAPAEGAGAPGAAAEPDPAGETAGVAASPEAQASAPGAGASRDQAVPDPLEKEREQRRLLEAEWRVRFANAREQLAIAEERSWVEVVRTELYQGIPVQMKVKEQVQTEELRIARRALADLEEEFRRTGLPAGWARETE